MLPEKIKSIIFSCTTIPQLETSMQWIEYIYGYNVEAFTESSACVKQRKDQLAICGIKSMTPQLIDELHKMD